MSKGRGRGGNNGTRYPSGIPYANAKYGPYIRIPMYPDDADKGFSNQSVIRPAYARFWANRSGTPYFDPIAPMLKTPYTNGGKNGPQPGGWWRATPYHVPQVHRMGYQQTQAPGPLDLQRMRSYATNWTGLRGALSGFANLFNGGN